MRRHIPVNARTFGSIKYNPFHLPGVHRLRSSLPLARLEDVTVTAKVSTDQTAQFIVHALTDRDVPLLVTLAPYVEYRPVAGLTNIFPLETDYFTDAQSSMIQKP
jgi:hypothetical protein